MTDGWLRGVAGDLRIGLFFSTRLPLAQAPPAEFVAALKQRGVGPISVGRVIVATWEPHGRVVQEVIRERALPLEVILNKRAVMVLPAGVALSLGQMAEQLAAEALDPDLGLGLVAVVMAVGGVVSSRRVAETMSKKITRMSPGQGLTANLVTSLLVAGASRLGLPVSTTHVSVGSLFGIGVVNGTARARMVLTILVAWVTTLPLGAVLAAGVYVLLRAVGVGIR